MAPVVLTAFYHDFGTDKGPSDLGHEFDLTATYKLTKQIGLLAGIDKFWSDQAGYADAQKCWLQADYKF